MLSKNVSLLNDTLSRLNTELKYKELPRHRRTEVESLIYYLKEDLRYLKGGKDLD